MSQGNYGQTSMPQGNYGQTSGVTPNIQSPLVWSILSTICCCIPFGIVSIVYASKVNSLLAAGAYNDAKEAADKAKMWAWIAFGVGLVVNAISFLINFAAVAANS